MSSTRMSKAEREAFLADLHVGVLSIGRGQSAPLTAPIWYDYEPGGEIWVLIGPDSLKSQLIREGTPLTLIAQREAMPYAYVSVEGRVTRVSSSDRDADDRPMAHRYLGASMGDDYVASTAGQSSLRVSIEPEVWRTVDYAKVSIG